MSGEQHKRCLGCGYILDGLPEPRCPECGRPFDPADPATFFTHLESGWPYLVTALIAFGAVVLPPWLAASVLPQATSGWLELCVDLPLVSVWSAGVVVEGFVCMKSIRALRRPRHMMEHRGAVVVAALLFPLLFCTVALLVII
jgi:hypothetical protein